MWRGLNSPSFNSFNYKTMPKTINIAGVVVYEENQDGYATRATTTGNIDTTTLKYAAGCILKDTTNNIVYRNTGTVASPVWTSETQTIKVSLTAAQIISMYTTAELVVQAVAGRTIIVDDVILDLTATSTQFTGGGVVGVQYKSTANGAGTLVHADIAASVVTGATGRIITKRIAVDLSSVAIADIDAQGLYISNKTAVFAAGTGTAEITVVYRLI